MDLFKGIVAVAAIVSTGALIQLAYSTYQIASYIFHGAAI